MDSWVSWEVSGFALFVVPVFMLSIKSFPGYVFDPQKTMWYSLSYCSPSSTPSKEDVIIFWLKTLVPTSVLSSLWTSLCPSGPYWKYLTEPQTTQNFQQQIHFTYFGFSFYHHHCMALGKWQTLSWTSFGTKLVHNTHQPTHPHIHKNDGLLRTTPLHIAVTATTSLGVGTPSYSSHSGLLIFYASFRIVTVLICLGEAEKHTMCMRVSTGKKERPKF